MAKCIICNTDTQTTTKNLLYVEVCCPKCGTYLYEKTFKTTLDFFLASQNSENYTKILNHMGEIVKKSPTCFVDDFESVNIDNYQLYELMDILSPLGISFAHTNVVDSDYKD